MNMLSVVIQDLDEFLETFSQQNTKHVTSTNQLCLENKKIKTFFPTNKCGTSCVKTQKIIPFFKAILGSICHGTISYALEQFPHGVRI